MILFRPEHEEPILSGDKTQTRRLWKRWRVKVGSEHLATVRPLWCNPPGKPFARLLILRRWKEMLGEISKADAKREGYPNVDAYLDAFFRINRIDAFKAGWRTLASEVHCVEFRCIADLRGKDYRFEHREKP